MAWLRPHQERPQGWWGAPSLPTARASTDTPAPPRMGTPGACSANPIPPPDEAFTDGQNPPPEPTLACWVRAAPKKGMRFSATLITPWAKTTASTAKADRAKASASTAPLPSPAPWALPPTPAATPVACMARAHRPWDPVYTAKPKLSLVPMPASWAKAIAPMEPVWQGTLTPPAETPTVYSAMPTALRESASTAQGRAQPSRASPPEPAGMCTACADAALQRRARA